ncbi:hypothetical protein IVB43_23715 [Bradyrhizobium sp. 48]|jgi:hypothetical protein|uniref:hypothetical protein n=1 Tax=Bradyrhizobium sp. 48 TaxID=2782676 RepID=UPI001FF987AB|nr:hypothetical protein [Bradyrhizobium sp. 48]MCK1445396.1 hypothetical protein [Bradyrhizobium sp. 48]
MKLDPVTGPVPREKFSELVEAPHGQAVRMIRRYDPYYGRKEGEPFKWAVRFTREIEEEGYGYVEAATEEEAEELGRQLKEKDLTWDVSDRYGHAVFDGVEPEV